MVSFVIVFDADFYSLFGTTPRQQRAFMQAYKFALQAQVQDPSAGVLIDSVIAGSVRVATRVVFPAPPSVGAWCTAGGNAACSALVATLQSSPSSLFAGSVWFANVPVTAESITVGTMGTPPAPPTASRSGLLSFGLWRIIIIAVVAGGGVLSSGVYCIKTWQNRRRRAAGDAQWHANAVSPSNMPSAVWGMPAAAPQALWTRNPLHAGNVQAPYWNVTPAQPSSLPPPAPLFYQATAGGVASFGVAAPPPQAPAG